MERFRGVSMRRLGAYLAWFKWTRGFAPAGGCSYSFVNWAMLFSRLNRDMLTPGLSADGLQSVRSASTRRRRAPCPA